jgi:signal transduction histidine kinase
MHTNEKEIYIALLIAAIILLFFFLYFFYTLLQQQRRNIALYQSKLAAEITVLEAERRRMAADLHDDLGPLMAGVQLYAGSLQPTTINDKAIVEKILLTVNEALQHIHTTAYDLLPNVLIRKGLIAAIDDLLQPLRVNNEIEVTFTVREPALQLSEQASIHLYRMMKEMLTNTIKHAAAKHIRIDIGISTSRQAAQLEITYSDDGKGFDTSTVLREAKGLGLRNIISRAELLQGAVYFSVPKGSTGITYQVELPYPITSLSATIN